MPEAKKPVGGHGGKTSHPPRTMHSPPKPPPPPPEPEEEEPPPDEEMSQEEIDNMNADQEGYGEGDEAAEQQKLDEAMTTVADCLQKKYARKASGPQAMEAAGDGQEGWIDELALPIFLAILQWWKNRQKQQQMQGGEGNEQE